MSSLDFLVSEHSWSRASTPRLRFGTPTMAERDAVRARSTTAFRAASSVWEDAAAEQQQDAARAVLQSWGQVAPTPPAPFPAFRQPGGEKFRHVPARYSGPVSEWRLGESNHSRRPPGRAAPGRHGKAATERGTAAADARLALWQAGLMSPAEGAVLRSDARRAAGARPPNQPPAMSKEAQAKYVARQRARDGVTLAEVQGDQTRTFAHALGMQIAAEHDAVTGKDVNTASAANLHHILRTVAMENESFDAGSDSGSEEEAALYTDAGLAKTHFKEPKEKYSEAMALQISLSQWRDEMEKEIDDFPSVALYCEHKLRETFAHPVAHEPVSSPAICLCVCSCGAHLTDCGVVIGPVSHRGGVRVAREARGPVREVQRGADDAAH